MTIPAHSILDELDAAIFAALQIDGRRSYRSISQELGIPEATVRFRINRMVREELVQVVTVIHPRHLGGILATLMLKVELPRRKAVADIMGNLRPVIYASVCSGRFDILAQVVVPGPAELNHLIGTDLAAIDGIIEVESVIELEVLKANYVFSGLDLTQPAPRQA